METLMRYLHELWAMTAQIAPWMIVGFALAGLMSMFVSRRLVLNILGRPGMGSIVKATLVGVPMPLCSCGVIPVAVEIREKGATKGATAAFLASTPETGVDSAIATWGMLGPVMALTRVFLAFVTGILAGTFVSLATRGKEEARTSESEDDDASPPLRARIFEALRHAFLKMPGEIAPSLGVGILLAAAVATFVPEEGFAFLGHGGLATYVGITLLALPMYVCSTGSIPLAAAMLQAGFSPGGALVFLVSGPATNIATIVAMRRHLGTRAIWAYLAAIVTTAWTAGAVMDALVDAEAFAAAMPCAHAEASPVGNTAAIVFCAMLALGYAVRRKKSAKSPSCCCTDNKPQATDKPRCPHCH